MAGGAAGFGYYLYMRQYWFPNPYKTQGVQNIEDRYSAGGGHPTHQPATASERGTGTFGPQTNYLEVQRAEFANAKCRIDHKQRWKARRPEQGSGFGALQGQYQQPTERGQSNCR